jgi:DNA-binding transcriptional LysR family regulator
MTTSGQYIESIASLVVKDATHFGSFRESINGLSMHDRLSGIEVFVHAVDAGSFSQAAERLHLTLSAVAKTIARLEQRLATRLFHRTTRTQSLTEDGQAFYERCVRALAELDAGEAALDSGRHEPSGSLRISAPVLFGRYCVAPLLVALSRRHPRLSLEMSFNDRIVDLVGEGIDLAVRIGTLPDSSSLASRRLGTQRMAIWAAPDYLDRRGRPRDLDNLAGHTGIVYGRAGMDFPWRVQDRDLGIRELRLDSRLRLDDLEAIADAAVAGAGLAWLPCWLVARHVRAGELELVTDSEHALASEIHAVWPQTRYLPAKTRAAIDTLVAGIPPIMDGWAAARRRRAFLENGLSDQPGNVDRNGWTPGAIICESDVKGADC